MPSRVTPIVLLILIRSIIIGIKCVLLTLQIFTGGGFRVFIINRLIPKFGMENFGLVNQKDFVEL